MHGTKAEITLGSLRSISRCIIFGWVHGMEEGAGDSMKTYLENESLIDNKTGLMRIPLMCDRCKKSEEVLYRVRRWSICKNCAEEYREMKEEHNRNMSENREILRELKNAEFPWFRSLFSFIWR